MNVFAENMFSHVNNESFTLQHLFQIVDTSSDGSAVAKSELCCTSKRGIRQI